MGRNLEDEEILHTIVAKCLRKTSFADIFWKISLPEVDLPAVKVRTSAESIAEASPESDDVNLYYQRIVHHDLPEACNVEGHFYWLQRTLPPDIAKCGWCQEEVLKAATRKTD